MYDDEGDMELRNIRLDLIRFDVRNPRTDAENGLLEELAASIPAMVWFSRKRSSPRKGDTGCSPVNGECGRHAWPGWKKSPSWSARAREQ